MSQEKPSGPPPRPETAKAEGVPSLLARFKKSLGKQVDGASLAVFRIAFGLIMCLEAYTLTQPIGSIAGGITQLQNYYNAAESVHFPYAGFGWLPILPEHLNNLVVLLLGLGGLAMAAGFFYRWAAALVFATWGYFYAAESTRTYWMSYYYLELLIGFLMIWMPAARCFSVEAWRSGSKNSACKIPQWPLILLRGQLVITYFYAGVAKLTADWMFDAMPVRYFLAQPQVFSRLEPLIGASTAETLRQWVRGDGVAYFLSWAGAVFDLGVGFLLLWRRTRILGLILMFIFHGTNHFVIFSDIVWFPLVGVTTALIFLDPDWPQRLGRWLKKPAVKKPDLAWLGAGAILAPVVGAALGWKLAATREKISANTHGAAAKWIAPFVLGWLVWQAVVPARHYLIPGDARMTFEGLSFSWRLKAEVYRANPAEIFLRDPKFIAASASGPVSIDWSQWKGDRTLFQIIETNNVPWEELPEICTIFEPVLGERIIYNPFATQTGPALSEAQAKERVEAIWQALHGRKPEKIQRTIGGLELANGYATAIRSQGGTLPTQGLNLLETLGRMHGRKGDGQLLALLRRVHPFSFEAQHQTRTGFMLIEDSALIVPGEGVSKIDRMKWKSAPAMQAKTGPVHANGDPVVSYAVEAPGLRQELPQACILAWHGQSKSPPEISWDYARELSPSKQMHISTQPFLLRRYARMVADRWEKQTGWRPEVHARTGLSMHLRPPQATVDPEADLASVPARFMAHNAWIRDLEMPRIPRESLRDLSKTIPESVSRLEPPRASLRD